MTAVKNVSKLHRHQLNVTFRVFELRINIYPSITHSSIQSIHNHGQFYRPQWAWHSTHKDCLPWIQGVRTVHHKIRVIKIPWSDLNLDFIGVKKGNVILWKADLADPLSWRRCYYYYFGDTRWDMESHLAKACTPSDFLFQQKISCNPSFYYFEYPTC